MKPTPEELKREFAIHNIPPLGGSYPRELKIYEDNLNCFLDNLNALLDKLNEGKHTFTYDELKGFCCAFFRHWWNVSGNNTEQGFDEWFRSRMGR